MAQNEIQRLYDVNQDVVGGTYTLTFGGNTTGALDYFIFSGGEGDVETALEGLASIGEGNIQVSFSETGGYGNSYLIEFVGTLANADQPAITVDSSALVNAEEEQGEYGIVTEQEGSSLVPIEEEVGLCQETDSLGALLAGKARSPSLVSETDASAAMSAAKSREIGCQAEEGILLALLPSKSVTLGCACESEQPLSLPLQDSEGDLRVLVLLSA